MEQSTAPKGSKPKTGLISTVGLRVKRETKRRVLSELAKANKKEFGRKVRTDELISLALSLLESRHISELQERSLTNADKLQRQYNEYVKKNGAISKDAYIGRLLAGEALPTSTSMATPDSSAKA
jgi:hypothetical protein